MLFRDPTRSHPISHLTGSVFSYTIDIPYHLSSANDTQLLNLRRCQSLAGAELATWLACGVPREGSCDCS